MKSHKDTNGGKVAIVEIASSDTSILLIEVALDGQTLTISDQEHTISDDIRTLAQALIARVKEEHNGSNN